MTNPKTPVNYVAIFMVLLTLKQNFKKPRTNSDPPVLYHH